MNKCTLKTFIIILYKKNIIIYTIISLFLFVVIFASYLYTSYGPDYIDDTRCPIGYFDSSGQLEVERYIRNGKVIDEKIYGKLANIDIRDALECSIANDFLENEVSLWDVSVVVDDSGFLHIRYHDKAGTIRNLNEDLFAWIESRKARETGVILHK